MRKQVEGQLTLFPAVSPASPFPLPGSVGAGRMTASSGRKWSGLSKNCGPLGLLEKMLLESCGWRSPIFYLNWKPVDIGQGHFLYQLALSAPGTGGIGRRSLDAPNIWKTPVASDAANRKMYVNSRGEPNLSGQVKLWPTPTAQDAKNSTLPRSQRERESLVGEVIREELGRDGQLNPDWVEWLMGFPAGWTQI